MAFQPAELYDYLKEFSAGVNQGIDVSLLPRNQLANGVNTTVRGTLVGPRPQFRKITLSFASDSVRAAMESGYWQGGCFYQPNANESDLMAAISGRLFRFAPDLSDGAVVTEHTIAGDANPSGQPQAWLWQSENFLIWNDGVSLPVFFDGTTSRRSAGASVNLGTTAATFVVPSVNSNVTLTLAANYTGPLNAVVNIGNFGNYLVVSSGTPPSGSAGYDARLKNGNDTVGATIPVGATVLVPTVSNVVGTTSASFVGPVNHQAFNVRMVTSQTSFTGARVTISGHTYAVLSLVSANGDGSKTFSLKVFDSDPAPYSNPAPTIPAGTSVLTPYITPQQGYTIGTVSTAFTVPAVGANVTVQLSTLWTGPAAGTAVQINGKSYTLFPVTQVVTPSTTVVVKNLTDSPGITRSTALNLLTLAELPIGRMGAYGLGRNWMSLSDSKSFIASDLVGGSSGTTAYSFKDAPLKVTENTFLNGGGVFVVPSSGGEIRAMIFAATLDVSLGQGPLQVLTQQNAFSCNAPIDRTIWQNLTNPILTQSLIGSGAQGQDSTIISNSDIKFRSVAGWCSLILARRQFNTWGNTPQSREVQPTFAADNVSLLPFGSSVEFDNRELTTASPIQGAQGVYHTAIVALNLDPISSLRGQAPAVYDGVWNGLNVLRLIKGTFSGVERLFAFHFNDTEGKIELYEILTSENSTGEGIPWTLESPELLSEDKPDKKTFKRLVDGEFYVAQLSGEVSYAAFYRSNQWPNWVPWHSGSIAVDPTRDPGFRTRIGLGEPSPDPMDETNNAPLREGLDFQLKLIITGQAQFRGARFKAVTVAQPDFSPPQ